MWCKLHLVGFTAKGLLDAHGFASLKKAWRNYVKAGVKGSLVLSLGSAEIDRLDVR